MPRASMRAREHVEADAVHQIGTEEKLLAKVKEALSHAIALCEGRTVGTPRRQKFETADRAEAMLELLEDEDAAARLEVRSVEVEGAEEKNCLLEKRENFEGDNDQDTGERASYSLEQGCCIEWKF